MSDAWNDIQALKSKQSSLRAKLAQRKKEREDFLAGINTEGQSSHPGDVPQSAAPKVEPTKSKSDASAVASGVWPPSKTDVHKQDKHQATGGGGGGGGGAGGGELLHELSRAAVEHRLLRTFEDVTVEFPVEVSALCASIVRATKLTVPLDYIENVVQKLAAQQLISIEKRKNMENPAEASFSLVVTSANQTKIALFLSEANEPSSAETPLSRKRKVTEGEPDHAPASKSSKNEPETPSEDIISIESLLAVESAKERENKKSIEEILELLSRPTAKEQYLVERFKSQGGALQEFCSHGTREECTRTAASPYCTKVHFKKIINKHTDESLGDCSFLNTCFHMDTCKYVHYTIDQADVSRASSHVAGPGGGHAAIAKKALPDGSISAHKMMPAQWVQCDLRTFDVSVLGKFAVIMADPPWDIHMELPYGTMSDDEMRSLNIPSLQDDGYIFLWVTGRAMELGRECLELWGYQRCDELIWVKTNQLQRIIRTGRTGHWINHGKEHCLIGVKGSPKNFNRGLDCDVIVAEVRATSHKPDEVYGIIERLAPGTRKIELFGRPHNVQPNWVTLGNQLEGVQLHEEEVVKAFIQKYPDGNCMNDPKVAKT